MIYNPGLHRLVYTVSKIIVSGARILSTVLGQLLRLKPGTG